MNLEKLQLRSTELGARIYRLRGEDYRVTYDDWCEWWNLSGIDDIGVMPYNTPFNYVLKTSPFDYWKATIEPQSLIGETDWDGYSEDKIEGMVNSIKETITWIEGEEPHTVAFTSIPTPCGYEFELVGLAKIDNNGTSYVFSNDLEYLKYLKSKGL